MMLTSYDRVMDHYKREVTGNHTSDNTVNWQNIKELYRESTRLCFIDNQYKHNLLSILCEEYYGSNEEKNKELRHEK